MTSSSVLTSVVNSSHTHCLSSSALSVCSLMWSPFLSDGYSAAMILRKKQRPSPMTLISVKSCDVLADFDESTSRVGSSDAWLKGK